MTTQEAADKLKELWLNDQNEEAIELFYPKDLKNDKLVFLTTRRRSGSNAESPRSKFDLMFIEAFHDSELSDVVIMGDYFCYQMKMDVTIKDVGRGVIQETWVFQFQNDEIVYERSFKGHNLQSINSMEI